MHLKYPYNTKEACCIVLCSSQKESLYLFMKTLEAVWIVNAHFNFLKIFKWCLRKCPVGYLWEVGFESQQPIWHCVSEVPEFLCWDGSWDRGSLENLRPATLVHVEVKNQQITSNPVESKVWHPSLALKYIKNHEHMWAHTHK